jgi:outer membrane protein assembly factor BamD (BamD/ComL family)
MFTYISPPHPERPDCDSDAMTLAEMEGISFHYYDPGANFEVGNEGYEEYLKLWPDGPEADEAIYKTHFGGRLYPGSLTEIHDLIQRMREFVRKYPASRY